jgi:protein involved in polysaccharide export with SLBB domain
MKALIARGVRLAIALTFIARLAAAQQHVARQPLFETRAQLQATLLEADKQHRTTEVALLRSRLEHGDFQEGDKILLAIDLQGFTGTEANVARRGVEDTVLVRSGKMLHFASIPNIPDLSLEGVLRAELTDTITSHLGTYIRDPKVRAVPLLRVAVLGAVSKPGWYSTRTDAVLADLIMQAGGVNQESDVSKTLIKRAGEQIWNSDDVRTALADGLSLDRLNLRAGDEVFISPRRQWNLGAGIQVAAALTAIIVAVRALHQSHN